MLGFYNTKSKEVPSYLKGRKYQYQDRGIGRIFFSAESKEVPVYPGTEKTRFWKDSSIEFWDYTGTFELDKFVKPNFIGGTSIEFGDKQTYIVPKLRKLLDGSLITGLPSYISVGNDGALVSVVDEDYLAIDGVAQKMIDSLTEKSSFAMPEILEFIAQVLSVNYEISIAEVLVYKLVNQEIINEVMDAALDLQLIYAWLDANEDAKKKLISKVSAKVSRVNYLPTYAEYKIYYQEAHK